MAVVWRHKNKLFLLAVLVGGEYEFFRVNWYCQSHLCRWVLGSKGHQQKVARTSKQGNDGEIGVHQVRIYLIHDMVAIRTFSPLQVR